MLLEIRRDFIGAAQQTHQGIDDVATQLEHLAAAEFRQLFPLLRTHRLVNCGLDQVDVTEPPLAGGLQHLVDAGVVAPHVSLLDDQSLSRGSGEDRAQCLDVEGRRLLEMQVLASFDSAQTVTRMVGHRALDCDRFDGRVGQQVIRADDGDPLPFVPGTNRRIVVPEPHEVELRRGLG